MATKVTVTTNLSIGTTYRGVGPTSHTRDLEGNQRGPAPGVISASISGTDVDPMALGFSRVGEIEIWNQDATNYIEWGVYDPQANVFYPVGEVMAGKRYVFMLSRNFGEEWASIGTGTGTSPENNRLRFRANTAPCNVFVGLHER